MNPSQRNLFCLLTVLVRKVCGGVGLVRGDRSVAKCARDDEGWRVGAPVAAYANKSSVRSPSETRTRFQKFTRRAILLVRGTAASSCVGAILGIGDRSMAKWTRRRTI